MAEFLSFGLNGPLGAMPGLLAATFVPLPDTPWAQTAVSIIAGSISLNTLGGTGFNLKTAAVAYEAIVIVTVVMIGVFFYRGFLNIAAKSTNEAK